MSIPGYPGILIWTKNLNFFLTKSFCCFCSPGLLKKEQHAIRAGQEDKPVGFFTLRRSVFKNELDTSTGHTFPAKVFGTHANSGHKKTVPLNTRVGILIVKNKCNQMRFPSYDCNGTMQDAHVQCAVCTSSTIIRITICSISQS